MDAMDEHIKEQLMSLGQLGTRRSKKRYSLYFNGFMLCVKA